MEYGFDFENEIKELGTCIDFVDMDEDMWTCLNDRGKLTDEDLEDYLDYE